MKAFISFLIISSFIFGCKKGENYCEPPVQLESMEVLTQNNAPNDLVRVKINYIPDFSKDHENDLFSFSVPPVFINPKGDNRTTDVITQDGSEIIYTYRLKDTTNPPASVQVEAYLFNDCGKSNIVKATITYDTTGL